MRIKRKLSLVIVGILLLLMFVGYFNTNTVKAADNTLSVAVSTSEVIVGTNVNVSVTLSYSKGISTAQFYLNYDPAMFAYVSGDASGTSYAGSIPIIYMPDDYPTSHTWNFTFKTIQTGTGAFSTEGDVFIDPDINAFTPVTNSTTVKIWAEGSDDATLNNLQVVGTTLTPAFAKWTMAYTVYVGSNTTAVDVAATSTQGGRVEIAGNTTNLAYGNNVVTVTSYAPNGKAMQYTITIVRPEPVTEPPTTIPEPTTLPPEWTEVVVNGISYNINSEYSKNVIPAGFETVIFDYKGNQVLAATNSKSGLILFYLVDGMENGKFFIYDADKDVFYDYVQVDSINNKYIVMPLDKADIAPPDTIKGKVTINGYETDAYIDDTNKEFAYFYAVNSEGTYGWYSYDMIENTIQRYVFLVEEETTVTETTEEYTTEDMTTTENEGESHTYDWISENESLKAANDSLKDIRNIAIIVAGVLLVVLIALIVILLAHKSEKKHSIGMNDIDYARLEEEDDEGEENSNEEDSAEDSEDEPENESEDVSTATDEQAVTQEMNLFDEAIANGLSKAKEAAAKEISEKPEDSTEDSEDASNESNVSTEEASNKTIVSTEEVTDGLDIAIEEIIMTDEVLQDSSKKSEDKTDEISEQIEETVQQDEDDEDFL